MYKFIRIQQFAKRLFTSDRESQKAGEIIESILAAKSPRLSDIAASMKGKYEANYKKIQRFLDDTNPKEQLQMLFNEEAEFVLCDPTEVERPDAEKTEYVGTLKDGKTKGFWTMTFATALRGRAIPFHFLTYSSRTFEEQVSSRNLEHHKAIQEVLQLIGDRPVIFDREFSYLELLTSLLEANVKFVIRLNMGANPPRFFYDRDQKIRLYLRIAPNNKPQIYRQVYYMGLVKVNVVGIWQYGFKDPLWLITTMEPEEALDLYVKRMKIETSFRDLKSLLHMDKVMNKSQQRLERILALMMIAYAISLLIGEAIRDVQYAQVHPGDLDLLTIPSTVKRSKWHSFSGPFLLLKQRYRLEYHQLRQIVSYILKIFTELVFGKNVRSFVRS
ncbi:MAG: transposase [Campylobacterales bacterium]|nr:transposase [Campylobacterales bacterium]